ncbi:MAG: hypothetical protein AAGN35_26115 [Bacteroidota bacterium]
MSRLTEKFRARVELLLGLEKEHREGLQSVLSDATIKYTPCDLETVLTEKLGDDDLANSVGGAYSVCFRLWAKVDKRCRRSLMK